jgi:WD40 repeat protein
MGTTQSCRFSEDGQYVLTGFNDCTACVWNAGTGKLVTTLAGHLDRVRDLRFNPDQTRLLSWAVGGKAIVWDMASPLANPLVFLERDAQLLQAHWSRDGRDIITSWSDGKIDVWKGATMKDLDHFPVRGIDFENSLRSWRLKIDNHQTH